ncbi:fructose-specific PTS transporter subunit EIIC [Isobaculum melis]|uniref:PTS system IIA component, Fru family /PTS system IIB component, Fru family /PTS system IIC component, Fru family n=1 Tax=Isobaculum melis TaxID=142588 RepID=A0A1H9Q3P9_9LACT|nr:fructose-specific PTS transporter subunit EIIC [Isobaculum melis]SER55060.1 PTS system IIA component, Fru family /PTS system IIB component, Fru family /PTS system IIC component, Fru family [Isobaculum melis]
MNIASMTKPTLIQINRTLTSRNEILTELAKQLYESGYITDIEEFIEDVQKREKHSETGMENGLAIPHGKSKAVKKAGFAVMTLESPLAENEWPSIDASNKVELIFLLAIPDDEAGTTHLQLLAELSSRLMNQDFVSALKNAQTSQALYELLSQEKEGTAVQNIDSDKFVLAVTACATGIAHTYMAAEALEQKGAEMGIKVHVEKQGANGIEDRITPEMIAKADGVIFAVDTKVKEKERFAGKAFVETKVAEPLKNSEKIIQAVLEAPQGIVKEGQGENQVEQSGKKKGLKDELMAAVMTGISYMIPLLVAAGLMLGIAKLIWILALGMDPVTIGDAAYNDAGGITGFLHFLDAFGNMLFKFIYPVFAMFAAYSIADRTGLIAGFAGGIFAGGLHYTFWGIEGGIPSGFLGALVLGLAAGYSSRFLNEKIRLSKNFSAMKPMFLIPGLSVLFIFILNLYVVDPVFGGLNQLIAKGIESMSGSGQLGLSAIIASATAFDLGGPVNKAAGAIAIGLSTDGIFPLTPRVLAIVIPPLGLGLSTMIDRYVVGRRVYPQDLRVAGGTSFLLGFLAISEGAIPFMLRNPLITIPINIIGAIVGSCTAVALGAVQWLPLPAIWGWPLVTNLPAYLIGLVAGVLVIAFGNILVRYMIIKRKEANGEKIDM